MSQHDFNIANQGFPATRADINNAFQAIASNSSGATAPSTTYANMWWYDTTNNKMYLRNEADSAWIEVATIDQTNNEWQITTGQISAVDGDGISFKTDDGITRAKLDDSGNLLVGKTSTDFGTAGIELHSNDQVFATSTTHGLAVNRLSTDGDIAKFYKDGTTVGSIGNNGGYLHIGSPQGTDAYIGMGSSQIYPATSTGGYRDAAIDLGGDNERFKDLYLSGGVYLGGTGSANKLDDYEEGDFALTFTPNSSGSMTMNSAYNRASYTKIGNLVTVTGLGIVNSVSSPTGDVAVNLPFTVGSFTDRAGDSVGSVIVHNSISNHIRDYIFYATESGTSALIRLGDNSDFQSDAAQQFQSGTQVYFNISYRT